MFSDCNFKQKPAITDLASIFYATHIIGIERNAVMVDRTRAVWFARLHLPQLMFTSYTVGAKTLHPVL